MKRRLKYYNIQKGGWSPHFCLLLYDPEFYSMPASHYKNDEHFVVDNPSRAIGDCGSRRQYWRRLTCFCSSPLSALCYDFPEDSQNQAIKWDILSSVQNISKEGIKILQNSKAWRRITFNLSYISLYFSVGMRKGACCGAFSRVCKTHIFNIETYYSIISLICDIINDTIYDTKFDRAGTYYYSLLL